jgi:hypothetical protein
MPEHDPNAPPAIGERISIIGTSSTGKCTIARHLATLIGGTHIELDALFWLPDWQESSTEDFQAKVRAATTASPRWTVSGNYFSHGILEIIWANGDTVIWLDLPLRSSFPRLLHRIWRRWRDDELLWGTSRENIWNHFKLWSNDSLPGYVLRNHRRGRHHHAAIFHDPHWQHLRRHRLRSPSEVTRFLDQVEREAARA